MFDKEMPARVIVGLVVLGVLLAGVVLLANLFWQTNNRSFSDCRDRDYPVLSKPERCVYSDGQIFVNRD